MKKYAQISSTAYTHEKHIGIKSVLAISCALVMGTFNAINLKIERQLLLNVPFRDSRYFYNIPKQPNYTDGKAKRKSIRSKLKSRGY